MTKKSISLKQDANAGPAFKQDPNVKTCRLCTTVCRAPLQQLYNQSAQSTEVSTWRCSSNGKPIHSLVTKRQAMSLSQDSALKNLSEVASPEEFGICVLLQASDVWNVDAYTR